MFISHLRTLPYMSDPGLKQALQLSASSNFQGLIITAPCKGCRELIHRFLNLNAGGGGDCKTIIHKNFIELLTCVDTFCDLCKFIQSDFYYCGQLNYTFKQDFNSVHSEVGIGIDCCSCWGNSTLPAISRSLYLRVKYEIVADTCWSRNNLQDMQL
jgi:hypothetical protein